MLSGGVESLRFATRRSGVDVYGAVLAMRGTVWRWHRVVMLSFGKVSYCIGKVKYVLRCKGKVTEAV